MDTGSRVPINHDDGTLVASAGVGKGEMLVMTGVGVAETGVGGTGVGGSTAAISASS